MKITVVGCAGSYPGPDSSASCYLLEAQTKEGRKKRTWRVLLELGNGALGQLHRYADPLAVDAVIFSHLHADHCLDLCGYYVMRKYHPKGAQPQIPVYGPSDTANRLARAYDLPLEPGMHEEFDFRTFDGAFEVGPFSFEPIPVAHPVAAFGLRISADGATVGYSGDTGPCAGLDRVASHVDMLIAEASFRAQDDNPPHLHLTGTDAGETAHRMKVPHLVLTHIPPWFDSKTALGEAKAVYSGPITMAKPGDVYEF